jgi:hypothetical protein
METPKTMRRGHAANFAASLRRSRLSQARSKGFLGYVLRLKAVVEWLVSPDELAIGAPVSSPGPALLTD